MPTINNDKFGGDELERELYESLRYTYQALLEGEDLTEEEERGLVLFYLGEFDKDKWIQYVSKPQSLILVANTISNWKKENKELLEKFKKMDKAKNGKALREGWM